MPRVMSVSDSVVVALDPAAVYAQVSDLTQMGRWSPENTGATVPAGGVAAGTVFEGHNKRGAVRWTTRCVVSAAEPGVRFAFRVEAMGLGPRFVRARIATWEYSFEPVDGGTRVTETWHDDRRWPKPLADLFDRIATRGHVFADFQRRNIATTLANLKTALEGPAAR